MLGNNLASRKNNFDFMRFVAAMMVVVSHAYPLTEGQYSLPPLAEITQRQTHLGTLGVDIFFIMSGFLVLHSFITRASVKTFLKSRFLRLFPGLFVVTMLSALVLGPLITTSNNYWRDPDLFYYLRNISILWVQNPLPGVFLNNPYPVIVNGSLWTIPIEAKSYLVLVIAGLLGFYRRLYLLWALFIYSLWNDGQFFMLFRYFSVGMLFYIYRDKISLRFDLLVVCLISIVTANYFGILNKVLPLTGAYIVLFICLSPHVRLQSFGKYGDLSYGIYIYAFPIQQLVSYYGLSETPIHNFVISVPFILSIAFLSWHLIENPCLKLKTTAYTGNKERSMADGFRELIHRQHL